MDPAGLPALLDAIKRLHGLDATWLESVPVHETHEGQAVWEGVVQVFAVQHPKASRCYAWSHESGPGGRRKFHAVLGAPPVDDAVAAVRVAIVGEVRRGQNQGGLTPAKLIWYWRQPFATDPFPGPSPKAREPGAGME